MRKILLIAIVPATLFLLASCSGTDSKTTDVLADSATIAPVVNGNPATTTPVTNNVVTSPTTPNNIVVAPTTTTTPAPTTTAASGLNPAHGQPGHRCDISVGAPLNSKPTTAATTTTTPTITPQIQSITPTVNPTVTTTTTQTPTVTGPGMNPAHGQPGHRCDISVGAPLNSKPTSSTNPISIQPAKTDSPKQ